jgi:hypothetical protein
MESRPESPPISTTSLPSTKTQFQTPTPIVKPPILASDILRDEVAPIAPARVLMRAWLGGLALAFGVVAFASQTGIAPQSEAGLGGSVAAAVVAAIAAVAPAPYAARAVLAAIAGLVPLVLGVRGEGPLAPLSADGQWPAAALAVFATALPGVLLFRARYRAFRVARWLLAVALLASAPAVLWLALSAAYGHAPLEVRVADGVAGALALTALAGFLGAETTGGCTAWAALVLVACGARLAVRALAGGGPFEASAFAIGAAGELIAATAVAVALYQLLAATFARFARKVDVHKIVGPSAEGDS